LRHAHASGLLAGGADIQVVKELLGHGSIRTTELSEEPAGLEGHGPGRVDGDVGSAQECRDPAHVAGAHSGDGRRFRVMLEDIKQTLDAIRPRTVRRPEKRRAHPRAGYERHLMFGFELTDVSHA
jgi:hypothetical protein